MKFLVRDGLVNRHNMIRKIYSVNVALGIQIAHTNYEWIMHRAIVALGRKLKVKSRLLQVGKGLSLKQYSRIWDGLFVKPDGKQSVKPLMKIIKEWENFSKKGFILRHVVAKTHKGEVAAGYREENLEILLSATEDVYKYLKSLRVDLYARMQPPRNKKVK